MGTVVCRDAMLASYSKGGLANCDYAMNCK
jgi:hypothetical protein